LLATHREGQRTQACFRDFLAALEAIAVAAVLEAAQRCIDLVQGFRLHLDERELDILLDVDLGALALVEHVALFAALGSHVANATLHFGHEFAATVLEHLAKLVVTARLRGSLCLRRCRSHGTYRSFSDLPWDKFNRARRPLSVRGDYAIARPLASASLASRYYARITRLDWSLAFSNGPAQESENQRVAAPPESWGLVLSGVRWFRRPRPGRSFRVACPAWRSLENTFLCGRL